MKPVLSSTGAVRLEDTQGRALLVQIAQKSMLMDVKAGRRLVDGIHLGPVRCHRRPGGRLAPGRRGGPGA